MEKKLRKKFILFSVGTIFFVVILIASFINITTYRQIKTRSNALLDILVVNDGQLPSYIDEDNPYPETTYSNRFFTVKTDLEKNVITVNTKDVYLTSGAQAVEFAKKILKYNKQVGYVNNFKYKIANKDYGILIVFVDLTKDWDIFHKNLETTILVSFFTLLAVAVISYIFSKVAVSPLVKAYEKQNSFITDASHELKTPLAIINTSTDVLEMENGENKWTNNIHKQVNHLSDLIGDLIALTKLDETSNLEFFEFSFSDVVEDEVEDFMEIFKKQNKNIILNIEKNITYNGNEKLIRKLVSILIDNASKYSLDNSDINVNLYKQNRRIVFSVENDAENLEVRKYDELFQRFYREDSSRNRMTGGYGIGLSIAQSIVQNHKGRISAESLNGKSIIISAKF